MNANSRARTRREPFRRHLRRFLGTCIKDVKKDWPRVGDQYDLRDFCLVLADWGKRHLEPGTIGLLSYERIKAIRKHSIYEMRITDTVGGKRNIRVIFFEPPDSWEPLPDEVRPMPLIWVLEVIVKKRDDWTHYQIERFEEYVTLVQERFYT